MDSKLRPILEHQIGGNVYPANAMDFGSHSLVQVIVKVLESRTTDSFSVGGHHETGR